MRLPRIGRRGTYTPHAGGGNERVSRESRRSNRSIVRVSGGSSKLHEMNPRKHRAASHKAGGVREPHALRRHPSPRPQHPNETPRDGKIRTSCMIRGVCAAKRSLRGKIFARCIPERRFAGHFGYMARESCQSQLISDAWRANLAANWRFSRPRPLSGCMERKTCHGLMPGNAPRRNLATARHSRTHRASILPLPVRPRAHQGAIPHRQTLGNAFREHSAIVERPGTH